MRLFLRFLTLVVRLSTARSQSYPPYGEAEDDILEEHALNTQLLQVSHALHRGPISGDFWDLKAILTDSPPGAFLSRMGVLVQAVSLTYNTSRPLDNNSTSTGSAGEAGFSVDGVKWERLREFDRDPTPGGVFARVFVDRQSKAGVVVFKGICTNPHLEQCQIDQCYLIRIQNYGLLSPTVARLGGFSPEACAQHQQHLDYTAQANQFIHQVQIALPEYQLLLTGHSLGGMLAIVTAAQQPNLLKALTFAPTPFNVVMKQELNFSQEQIRALPVNELVATCDPYDCGINAVYAQQARAGSETCLYLHTEEPAPCQGLVLPYGSTTWREQVSNSPNSTNITAAIPELLCKGSAHRWRRYVDVVLRRNSQGRPANLPVCSTDFSVLETALQTAR